MLMDGGFDANGAYFESPMYHKYAMEYLTTFASALLRSGGENLFEYRGQLLRKSCLYNLYMMEPTRDHFAPFNDGRRLAGRPPAILHPAGAYFARIAAIHEDGLIRWLFDNMSESHSVVLIDGKGQRTSGMLGAIRDFLHTDTIDYFEADSSAAYAPAELVTRHVVFMRPGYFIVADHVRKDDAPHEYQWLLHSQVMPPTTEIQVRDSGNVTFKARKASLEVRLFSPEDTRMEPVEKNGHRFLRVTPQIRQPEARFLALLYPTSPQHTMPRALAIRKDGLVGCDVGDDTVLWATSPGEWQHGPVKTDARLVAFRRAPRAVFVKSARMLEAEPFAFKADLPVTAVLTAAEARLTVSRPTVIEFGNDYLAGGIVFETDHDRDPTNDRRVAAVEGNSRVRVPAGAFTIRPETQSAPASR